MPAYPICPIEQGKLGATDDSCCFSPHAEGRLPHRLSCEHHMLALFRPACSEVFYFALLLPFSLKQEGWPNGLPTAPSRDGWDEVAVLT